MTRPYVGRLAPAPTGALHLGNARTFLVAWLRARKAGGRLILRLEDLDHPKVRPSAAMDAYRDLAWLGLDWDEGPEASFPPFSSSGGKDPFVQSNRREMYGAAMEELRRGGFVYPCACRRKDLEGYRSAPQDGEDAREFRYPGTCRGRFATLEEARREAGGGEPAWRFSVAGCGPTAFDDGFGGRNESDLESWSGDFVVARGNLAGYQLAVVVDDAAMGVTEVVRGGDLLASTHRQLAVYRALGMAPPAFYHVPLVVGPDGRRLAKRHGDARIRRLREGGKGPEAVLGWLAWSCGWGKAGSGATLAEISARCDFSLIPPRPVAVDSDALGRMGLG